MLKENIKALKSNDLGAFLILERPSLAQKLKLMES